MRDHVAIIEAEQQRVAERTRAARLAKAKQRLTRGRPSVVPKREHGASSTPVPGTPDAGADLGEDAEFLLDAWDSDNEGVGAKRRPLGCEAACCARSPVLLEQANHTIGGRRLCYSVQVALHMCAEGSVAWPGRPRAIAAAATAMRRRRRQGRARSRPRAGRSSSAAARTRS